LNSGGNVLATTVTDRSGKYSFNQLTGVSGTGEHAVSLVVPSGFSQSSKNPSTLGLMALGQIQPLDS
jgi:hypothetical protein